MMGNIIIPEDCPEDLKYFVSRDYASCVFRHDTMSDISPIAKRRKLECYDCDVYFCDHHIKALEKMKQTEEKADKKRKETE